MDIIKTFLLNDTSHEVKIIIKDGKPLFQANQIGRILDIRNVRESIKNFDEDEKVVSA